MSVVQHLDYGAELAEGSPLVPGVEVKTEQSILCSDIFRASDTYTAEVAGQLLLFRVSGRVVTSVGPSSRGALVLIITL